MKVPYLSNKFIIDSIKELKSSVGITHKRKPDMKDILNMSDFIDKYDYHNVQDLTKMYIMNCFLDFVNSNESFSISKFIEVNHDLISNDTIYNKIYFTSDENIDHIIDMKIIPKIQKEFQSKHPELYSTKDFD